MRKIFEGLGDFQIMAPPTLVVLSYIQFYLKQIRMIMKLSL